MIALERPGELRTEVDPAELPHHLSSPKSLIWCDITGTEGGQQGPYSRLLREVFGQQRSRNLSPRRSPTETYGSAFSQHPRFSAFLSCASLTDIRFHDLRHTCATLLLSRGVHAKLVQKLLGHATISVTLDTYSHVLPGMGDGLADTMDEALG